MIPFDPNTFGGGSRRRRYGRRTSTKIFLLLFRFALLIFTLAFIAWLVILVLHGVFGV